MSTAVQTRSAEQVARAYFKALADRDIDAMLGEWRPGSVDSIHGMAEMHVPDGFREWFGALFAAVPDFATEVVDLVADDEKVAVRWRATGTFDGTGSFEGLAPNGASIEIEGLDLLTIEDGLIVDNRAYANGMAVARALGAMPPQDSLGERAMLGAVNMRTRLGGLLRR